MQHEGCHVCATKKAKKQNKKTKQKTNKQNKSKQNVLPSNLKSVLNLYSLNCRWRLTPWASAEHFSYFVKKKR